MQVYYKVRGPQRILIQLYNAENREYNSADSLRLGLMARKFHGDTTIVVGRFGLRHSEELVDV